MSERQNKIKAVLYNDHYTIYNGNVLDMKEVIKPNSIDSIICDPPYHLTSITERFGKENSAPAKYGEDGSFSRLSKGFMNQTWDGGDIAFRPETWRKCYEVLKPGGYLLAFGGSRTFHRMAVAIEDAGFEIRDTIMWLYGTGFPKSMNIGKAVESKLTTGSSNTQEFKKLKGDRIDTKIGFTKMQFNHGARPNDYTENSKSVINVEYSTEEGKQWQGWGTALKPALEPIVMARKPLDGTIAQNVLKHGVGGINIDECKIGNEERTQFSGKATNGNVYFDYAQENAHWETVKGRFPANVIHDDSFQIDEETQANRYFYTAKASKKDRDEGLDSFEQSQTTDGNIRNNEESTRKFGANSAERKNIHPTVKPTELMQYLVRLVAPKGATILDPFMGSGSTGKAVMFENRERNANYKFIGIDLAEEYCKIADARIDYALNKYEYEKIKQKEKDTQEGKISIFDLI